MIIRQATPMDIKEGATIFINDGKLKDCLLMRESVIVKVLDINDPEQSYKGGDGKIYGLAQTFIKLTLSAKSDAVTHIDSKGRAYVVPDTHKLQPLTIERTASFMSIDYDFVINFDDQNNLTITRNGNAMDLCEPPRISELPVHAICSNEGI